jgi:hypothetical protein
MKISIKIIRWILLILYVAIIAGLLGMTYYHGEEPDVRAIITIFLFVVTVIAQTVFILGAGTANLCTPIRKRRLVIPVIIASVMMTVLIAGITLSLGELIFEKPGGWFNYFFWIVIVISWLVWSVIFFIWGMKTERYKTLRNFISTMLAGSLLSLMVSIPSHIIVSRRPGCFVGLATALGISSGIFVMLWAFGPGIIILFLREKRKAQLQQNVKV